MSSDGMAKLSHQVWKPSLIYVFWFSLTVFFYRGFPWKEEAKIESALSVIPPVLFQANEKQVLLDKEEDEGQRFKPSRVSFEGNAADREVVLEKLDVNEKPLDEHHNRNFDTGDPGIGPKSVSGDGRESVSGDGPKSVSGDGRKSVSGDGGFEYDDGDWEGPVRIEDVNIGRVHNNDADIAHGGHNNVGDDARIGYDGHTYLYNSIQKDHKKSDDGRYNVVNSGSTRVDDPAVHSNFHHDTVDSGVHNGVDDAHNAVGHVHNGVDNAHNGVDNVHNGVDDVHNGVGYVHNGVGYVNNSVDNAHNGVHNAHNSVDRAEVDSVGVVARERTDDSVIGSGDNSEHKNSRPGTDNEKPRRKGKKKKKKKRIANPNTP